MSQSEKHVMHPALPTVGYYGLNHNGYEVIELKESHVLRMFDADEITAQPVCLMEDALDAITAIAQSVQQTSTIEPVAYRDPDTQLTITATLKSLNNPRHARYSIALSHIEFEALKATSSYCIQPALSMSMFANKSHYEEAKRAQSVDLPDEQVALIKDAKRWRRLVNASEMAFPVLTIAEDPENDCSLKYGRQALERLVDMCDEISDASE